MINSLYSEFKNKPYLEQWERVGRWYEKLIGVKNGFFPEYNNRELLDVIYAYFMNVQHLKDWVYNYDENLQDDVMKFQNKSCFEICSDFINNHKHFKRNKTAKTKDRYSSIKKQHVEVTANGINISTSSTKKIENAVIQDWNTKNSCGAKYNWDISHNGKDINVYDLAKKCYGEWDDFLNKKNLL